jgi:hypothetical protein
MTTRRDPSKGTPDTPWRALVAELVGSTLSLLQQDNALEGGEISIQGGGNGGRPGGGTPFADWTFDSWSGMLRWFTGGIVKMTLETNGHLNVAIMTATRSRSGDVGHGLPWAGWGHSDAFGTTTYALLQKNDATDTRLNTTVGGQIGLYIGNVIQWFVNSSGHLLPEASNTRDIGGGSNRLRDVYIAGELIAENGSNSNNSNQAQFSNALTDIVGTSWAIGANERWAFEIFIPFQRDADPGTVSFTINGPAGATCGYTVFGSNTTTTFSEAYGTALNSAIATLGTSTSTNHFAVIRGRISTAGTGGTAVARGLTSAGTAGCIPLDGCWVNARRIV